MKHEIKLYEQDRELKLQDLRKVSTSERFGSKVKFIIPTTEMETCTPSDVMCAHGFNPLGYGSPFNITTEGSNTIFYCWGSCD